MSLDNIVDAIRKTSDKFPDKTAYIYYDDIISYKELKDTSDALACFIIDEFGEDKSPILVYGHKEIEMIICFLACQKSGHPYVPVESSLPVSRIRDIIENSETQFIFNIHNQEIDFQNKINKNEINELIKSFKGKVPADKYKVKGNDIFYILYTSGSTGKPKGVQITHDNQLSFQNCLLDIHNLSKNIQPLTQDEIYMCQVNYSFDVSCMNLYPSLLTGSTLYAIDKEMIKNLKLLFTHFKKSQISVWISTPSFAEMCLSDNSFNKELMPNLRIMLFCGEVLPNTCVKQLYDRFGDIKIINYYGPTEATVAITAIEIDELMMETVSPLPVGKALDNCTLMIIDEYGNVLPEGKTGEIHVYGDPVSPGYLNNPEMTAKAFYKKMIDGQEQQCYKTGDSGLIKQGICYCKGRIDFQVKLHGNRIEIEDIENNIRKLNYISSAVVIPVYVDSKVSYLHSVVTLKHELNESPFKISLKIKNDLKSLIPDYMIPHKFSIKDTLPINLSGKIDRKALMIEIEAGKIKQ